MFKLPQPYQPPTCPACGESTVSLRARSFGEFLKILFIIGLLAYVTLSVLLGLMAITSEFSGKNGPSPFEWMQPIARQLLFQVFALGGFIAGFLMFYWIWFEDLLEQWRRKRQGPDASPKHKYTCRYCGHQWG